MAEIQNYSTVVDYIFTSTFDSNNGITVTHTSSKYNNSITDQLDSILDSIIPQNLHKFINEEHYTILPLFINEKNDTLTFNSDNNDTDNNSNSLTNCYLYTISFLKFSNDLNRNSKIMAISLVTKLSIFEVFKPLLYYLLHELYNPSFNLNLIDEIFKNLNNSHLNDLLNHFSHLNSASRFVLTRIQPDFTFNDSLKLPIQLKNIFTESDNLYKTSINLGNPKLNFPIQIPKSSIIASPLAMFGIDLKRNSNIKSLIQRLDKTILSNSNSNSNSRETCLTPYANIKPLHVLLNALILKKKIILYAHNTCYNTLTDFAETLYLIYNSGCYSNSSIYFNPIIDLSSLNLIKNKESYLIGTSNPMLMEKLDWNLFLNFDSNTLNVQIDENEIDLKYYLNKSNNSSPTSSNFNSNRSSIGTNINNNNNNNFLDSNDDSIKYDRRISSNSNYTSFSMTPTPSFASNVSSIDSFQADSRLPYWDPSCFPRLIPNDPKAEFFLKNETIKNIPNSDSKKSFDTINSNSNFQFSKFPNVGISNSLPRIDNALDSQISRLVKNHHDDETLFVLLTNYLRNLTTRILPAFYHFNTFLKIRDYKSYLLSNSHLIKKIHTNNNGLRDFEIDLDSMIRKFIKSNHLIQPFPLNYPFNSLHGFLDDSKIISQYTKIVLSNISLLRLSIHYNELIFKSIKTIPGFIFTWTGGEENTNDDEIDIRLDTHYLISILDRMIDGTSSESWQLNKYLLLQIFKALNSILKINETGSSGLNDVLVDLFIERRGDESFVKACGLNLSDIKNNQFNSNLKSSNSSSLSNNNLAHYKSESSFLEKLCRLSVSSNNVEFIRDVIKGSNEDIDLFSNSSNKRKLKDSSLTNKSTRILNDKKLKSDLSTQHCEDDELLSHVGTLGTQRFTKLILVSALYLSIRGPEDIVETKKGIRRKDLLLTEFKRFLSGVLNDQFFKEFVLVEMDDFVKLTVNDFIDYHM
ncbi:hypothetical protein C6P40_001330 [Pichia californica]|uniref:UDENN domain-containing protein n=1 Tax=Pichia californica TaxID=460514 RepID=A0A9P6WJV0_9ASCO|nr:hypothetical protein C6P42_001440 [[Candida] californica]KAG0688154.1 hypothetical protein C6P40_001330 [[Candida] californica]